MKGAKWFIFIGGGALFFGIVGAMIYFGYKTFYIEQERVEYPTYDYHFVLISEELDNDYWRLVEQGARRAAEEKIFSWNM